MYPLNAGALSEVSTTAQYLPGEIRCTRDRTHGTRFFRYVQNKDAASIGIGEGCMQENGLDWAQVVLSGASTPNARLMGVRQVSALPTLNFGWVLADGHGTFASDGSTTADTIQKTVAAGRFSDGTAVTSENPVWAQETELPAGAGGLFAGVIRAL